MKKEQAGALRERRRMQIGTGDRSEKIRTYNYPDHRVTDHRIGLTLYNLSEILDGHLEPLVKALQQEERARILAEKKSS
jgi:peptide chain release factor 1